MSVHVSCDFSGDSSKLLIAKTAREPDLGRTARRWGLAVSWAAAADVWIAEKISAGNPVSIPLPTLPHPQHSFSAQRPNLGEIVAPLIATGRWPSRLYPYQRTGVRALVQSSQLVLADDMGLGKTVQVIEALRRIIRRGEARRVLIVAPTSLLLNWYHEIKKWAPELSVRHAGGSDSETGVDHFWNKAHVLLTNYEQMRSPPAKLLSLPPSVLVLDEAHRVKNWKSQTTTGLRRIKATRTWALTGTPLERDELDLIGLLGFVAPKRFGNIGKEDPPYILRAKAREYILRREKEDVLKDLPKVRYRTERVVLKGQQAQRYAATVRQAKTQNTHLATFNELRTLCDYDAESGSSAKLERIMELLQNINGNLQEKAIVFSYLVEPLKLLHKSLSHSGIETPAVYHGGLNASERDRVLHEFRSISGGGVLLASMRAAGEGLTLTEANHVLFFNRWWNPSANNQATDRVNRIGQTRPITVYYLEAADTVEARLSEILEEKDDLFDNVVSRLAEDGLGDLIN